MVGDELARPVDAEVARVARMIASRFGNAARSLLFYGSCLRDMRLDELMLDFYVIVSRYRDAYGHGWFSLANRLLPPNVFLFEQNGVRAKYAVISERDFRKMSRPSAADVSVIARFAQPSRMVWWSSAAAQRRTLTSVASASRTLFALARPVTPPHERGDPLRVYHRAFALTYSAELRAEARQRPRSIVAADPGRYARFGAALAEITEADPITSAAAARAWRKLRARGKVLTVLRLIKASTTFRGGIDYLAWKINRHAGTCITIQPWRRRHPIVGGLTLLPQLLLRGAIR